MKSCGCSNVLSKSVSLEQAPSSKVMWSSKICPTLHLFAQQTFTGRRMAAWNEPRPDVGSEQALAPVREPDTFAEGAWDKLTKTEGTFETRFLAQ